MEIDVLIHKWYSFSNTDMKCMNYCLKSVWKVCFKDHMFLAWSSMLFALGLNLSGRRFGLIKMQVWVSITWPYYFLKASLSSYNKFSRISNALIALLGPCVLAVAVAVTLHLQNALFWKPHKLRIRHVAPHTELAQIAPPFPAFRTHKFNGVKYLWTVKRHWEKWERKQKKKQLTECSGAL